MSQENVEVAKTFLAGVCLQPETSKAGARFLDPAVEIRPAIVGGPEGTVYRGPAGTGSSSGPTLMLLGLTFASRPKTSGISARQCSCSAVPTRAVATAALSLIHLRGGSLTCARAGSWAFRVSATNVMPSKLLGCRSRPD